MTEEGQKTGIEKVREKVNGFKQDLQKDKADNYNNAEEIFGKSDGEPVNDAPAKIEHHDTVSTKGRFSSIQGLEEVPTDIIPLPFYKLVQPGSTNIKINEDGEDADPGEFYQGDTGTSVQNLEIGIVRAKRVVKEFNGKKTASIGILAVNTATMSPFLMNIPVSSFTNFGRMMNVLNQRKVDAIWKYPIFLTSDKVETKKVIDGREQMVKYWVINFGVSEKPFDQDYLKTMETVMNEYAGTLDRDVEYDD